MELDLNKLETITVKATVIDKKLNNSLWKKLFGYGAEAGIYFKLKNPENGKIFADYIRATKDAYDLTEKGDVLDINAYKGLKNPCRIYLKPDEALLN